MKTRNKIYILLGVAFLMLGAKALKDNTLIIGDGVNTDKEIVLDIGAGTSNPRFIWNSASNSLQFTNDNSDILDIGSGSGGGGGGINVVEEGDFEREASIDDWVNTGTGVFARTTTAANVGNGGGAASYDAALATEKITSAAFLVPNVIADTLCIAEMWYKGGGTADLTMRVIDGSDVLVDGSELVISDATTTFKRAYTTFICPTEGESVKFQIESAGNADIIYIDDVFIGTKGLTRGAAGGWKVYDENDVSITITGATLSTVQGIELVPKKDPITGKWRLDFNIVGTLTAPDASFDIAINGATFSDKASFDQIITVDPITTGITARGYTDDNTSNIKVFFSSVVTAFKLSGNVALASKPTWADFDGTVNLLNNSVIGSNARFYSYGTSASMSIPDNAITSVNLWDNTTVEGGGSFDGEFYTIPADGTYEFIFQTKWNTSTISTVTGAGAYLYKNTSTLLTHSGYDFSASYFPSMRATYTGKFIAGDTVSVSAKQDHSGGSAESLRNADSETQFSGKRIPDVSSESALGFGEADADNAGLVSSEISQTNLTLSSDVSFSSGGNIIATRIGNQVTITGGAGIHSAAGSVNTAIGFLPLIFRPTDNIYNVYLCGSGEIYRIQAKPDGGLSFVYYTWAGGSASTVTSTLPWSISYTVSP